MFFGWMRRVAVLGGLVAAVGLSCAPAIAQSGNAKPFRVVTTFTVIQDIADRKSVV
jgi:ABC-type Zn uptake system ZnuABC Zn-binding protein ZnuA